MFGIGSIQFALTFFKQKSAISYLIIYKYVTQPSLAIF
jgi:hypothetical protein